MQRSVIQILKAIPTYYSDIIMLSDTYSSRNYASTIGQGLANSGVVWAKIPLMMIVSHSPNEPGNLQCMLWEMDKGSLPTEACTMEEWRF